MTGNISKSKGIRGYRGEKFTYDDFTPQQLEALKGEKGDKGDKGDTGEQGIQGVQGIQGEQGVQGIQGERGYTPSIVLRYDSATGNVYYSSDGILVDKEYVESQNLVTKSEIEEIRNQLFLIANKVAQTPIIITLYQNKWIQVEDKKWHQEIDVPNTTEYSMVDFMTTDEQFNYLVQNGIRLYTINDGGNVLAVCEGAIPLDISEIKVTVSEVVVSE